MFRKEPDDSGRQVGRVITRRDADKMGTNISSAQVRQKSQWIPTENPIQKPPCKRQQICYCRMNTGTCCHRDQRLALALGVDGGHSRVSQTSSNAERSALLSHRGQQPSSTAGHLVLPH